ncbi:RHS repeat domain-containing protein, partial [Akkermansia massiliensis]|uniref:RHS repeat domain-containing protein n=1 Tax=Akkermansia massiliensis TaxID=2927224 RepID=UPI00202F2C1E
SYLWDPTEPTATRILMMTCWQENGMKVKEHLYFMHDVLKNVTSIFDGQHTRRARYEYAPFGSLLTTEGDMAQENKFRFSCEFSDDELGLVYYNYRHLNPADGRWINRDPIQEQSGWNLFIFIKNQPNHYIDKMGLHEVIISGGCNTNMGGMDFSSIYFDRFLTYLALNAVKKLGFPTFHDRNWSNFITAAEEQIKKRKKVLGSGEKIEWLVEYETYRIRGINDKNGSQYYLDQIRKKAKELNVDLRFYKSKKELALLVNSVEVLEMNKTGTLTTGFIDRSGQDRISRFVYYGHGAPGSLTPRYPFPTHGLPPTEISITSEDINQGIFQQGSFIQGAVVISCGCNTATSPGNDKPSFAKVWEGFFGSAMYGVKGKTDYTDPKNPHPSKVPTNDPPKWIPKEPPL